MDKRAALLLILISFAPASCSDEMALGDRAGEAPDAVPAVVQAARAREAEEQAVAAAHQPPRLPEGLPGRTGAAEADRSPPLLASDLATKSAEFRGHAVAGPHWPDHPSLQPHPPPAWNRESYDAVQENRFINSLNDPLSTFSIDVDTASYANVRRFLNSGALPPGGAVRTEEMINYFDYTMADPEPGDPISLAVETGPSPFHETYRLVKIGLKAKDIDPHHLPPSNLVFLIDVSGSMNQPNKLPLLKQSLKLLAGQLSARDRVAIVVYAGQDRVVLEPTPGDHTGAIVEAIDRLQGGGSTHASSGIVTAYELALRSHMPGGNNRVILVSDGDFNVGITSRSELQTLIEEKRRSGVYLTVLGFGDTNYHDDTMEVLADRGNGNYAYIDSLLEAKKVLLKERSGTLFTVAEDVKIQVEFNPALVGAYRLIGYENRALEDEDFRDDNKDAGEIGPGHRVTALYEIIPAGLPGVPPVDALKYGQAAGRASGSAELLTVKLRYKPGGSTVSRQIEKAVGDPAATIGQTSIDFKFAASVAGFAMLLKDSEHLGSFGWDDCLNLAREGKGADPQGYRAEFARLVETAQLLRQQG